jgi:GDP-D-mannose 3',5'-epimerase
MNILVTGGAGMIGSNLVKKLTHLNHNVIVVDNLWRGKLDFLYENGYSLIDFKTNFYNKDLSIPNQLDNLLTNIDFVIHLADIVGGINYVFNNEISVFRQNILINSNTIHSVLNSNIKGFIYIGTACSFPQTLQNDYTATKLKETDLYPADPESAYGWSKLMGQYETTLLSKESNINTTTLMLHNVYGSPTDYSPERSQVIPSLIRKIIKFPEEQLYVFGDGNQSRSFIHVEDIVNGIILALEKNYKNETIQLGNENNTTINEIIEKLLQISNKKINPIYQLNELVGDKSRCADITKAKKLLGWTPKINLYDGLKDTYNWIKNDSKFIYF